MNNSSNVTLAQLNDIDGMVSISKRFHDQNDYANDKGYIYTDSNMTDALTRIVMSESCVINKYTDNGKIQGYMVVSIPTFSHLDAEPNTAFELIWHGDPLLGAYKEGKIMIALLDDMMSRLKGKVKGLQISASQESVLRLLERRGFRKSTVVYHWRA